MVFNYNCKFTVNELKERGFPRNFWYEFMFGNWGEECNREYSGLPFSELEWERTFWEIMGYLSEKEREVILLRVRDFWTFSQIGEKLDVSGSRASQIYVGAKLKIRLNSHTLELLREGYTVAMPAIEVSKVEYTKRRLRQWRFKNQWCR